MMFGLVYTDVCNPTRTSSNERNKCIFLIIDDYIGVIWTQFSLKKIEFYTIFESENFMNKRSGHSIKVLRSGRGNGYKSN